MEIFGLVIIVILVSLGLLFVLVVLTKSPPRSVEVLRENVQAANFLHSSLGTTVPGCNGRSLRELLQDCALAGVQGDRIVGASVCDDGRDSCSKVSFVSKQILEETFGKWGRTYEFFVSGTESVSLINASNGACRGAREGFVRPEKVRGSVDVNVTIYLC
ncbi:hypothetical protein D6825_01215 [Candidatus Woesearchaeota archaeon]|nr:MAG: hypothetical protein D6825_01215 [Candidatus Woesearchaeota archaeon]